MRNPSTPHRRALLTAGAAGLVLALTTTPVTYAAPHPKPPTSGSLVLIGGGLKADNTAVYGEIIKRAGGAGARIGIITAASVPASQDAHADDPQRCGNSACNGAYYADLFKRHGAADAQWVPVDLDHIDAADSEEVVAQINAMTGFFFGGGDQYRYVTTLLHGEEHTDSKVLAAIRAKLASGAVVAGSSAGAQIAAGRDMVTGGDSYQGLRDGSAPGYFDDPTRLGYLPAGGFGFLTSGLIDTHTGAYGREGRALRLAADTGHDRVYGLEENTALIVDRPGTATEHITVRGTNGVTILDLRRAETKRTPQGWSLHGARYNHLTDGDRYTAHTWTTHPAATKRRLHALSQTPVPMNTDVFYATDNPDGHPYSLLGTARALAATRAQRTATATTYETAPRFTVTLTKSGRYATWTSDGSTPATMTGLDLSITAR
ncbi:cyanophycinase [Streptomyces sp. H27-S2]|uniref:cyanophycinase n=1 Tax=Streptomyces antarcticus TaxID=2996458 RepID=UPI002271A73E|nr:cyanophycinase [Streptomyces sp. H27-S2]MCY0949100.1 cyanophycinase [Streptomyces sp. H27-S2]